jgi:hypothetical protein
MKNSPYQREKLEHFMETALIIVFFGIGYMAWRGNAHHFDCGEANYLPEISDLERYIKNILIHGTSYQAHLNELDNGRND